ncbi:MAG TPA: hypothetical protein VM100_01935 [Longimicrobiales bacterium]|nr:hypothetical protein [Longimicrobiales bacterium]
MNMNRRDAIVTGLSVLAGAHALAPAPAQSQTQNPAARLLNALQANRLPLTMTNRPAGTGWDWLVQQAREASITVIGEEHGVAETAQLSAALFTALRQHGYSRMAIELSPPIAREIEAAARRNGVQGIAEFLRNPSVFTFYNLQEEAQFVADVVAAAPRDQQVLWGFDREIFSDRYLISKLETKVPSSARDPFARLKQESANAWLVFEQSGNPDDLFILAGDPALVSAVRNAWRNPDAESEAILRTLEESLAIETAERTGGMWPYMQRRTKWINDNLAALIKDGQQRKPAPKLMMKGGYNHMIRGANYFNMFELGAMADEAATLDGGRSFHIIVLAGPGSRQAVPAGKRSFGAVSSDEFDEFKAGEQRISRVLSKADAAGHEVIDLRALRPLAMRGLEAWNADVVRTIHGYDAAVVWKGAHASTTL